MEKFCNKCFKFGKDQPQLKFAIWRCGHVVCSGCVIRSNMNTCVLCKIDSKLINIDKVLESTDPKILYKRYVSSIRIKFTQQNRMFAYYYNHMANQIREMDRKIAIQMQINEQRKQEIKNIEEEQEKMKRYINYYKKYFQQKSNVDRLSFVNKNVRPKTPSYLSTSTSSSAQDNEPEKIPEDLFSFLK